MATPAAVYIYTKDHAHTENPATITPPGAPTARRHQIAIEPGTAAGSLALKAIAYGCTTARAVLDEAGDAVVFDLTGDALVVEVRGVYSSFTLTPTAVAATYTVSVLGLE